MDDRILPLNSVLANQIAAGEVVERPASVIKELLENSLDANASKIEIEIEGAGVHLIRVRDDGKGIEKDDLSLAFARHATSKIRTLEDLNAIQSLGFRGEALASIASIARCRLTSAVEDKAAWQIELAPDLTPSLQPSAHPIGTTIEVADLFYNTPVRRKFLRSERTEFQAIDEIIARIALSHHTVNFYLKHQGKTIRFYPAAHNETQLLTRLKKICGQQFINEALPLTFNATGLSLQGWIGPPQMGERQATCQYFFVNQRAIKDKLLTHALRQIYQEHPLFVEGTYPSYVLYLTIDPLEVDVNVHPTKQEVRFSQARLVHDFISKAISQTLNNINPPLTTHSPLATTKPFLSLPSTPFPSSSKSQSMSSFVSNKIIPPRQEVSLDCFATSEPRYLFLEVLEGVYLISLKQAKAALWCFYLEKNLGHISSKPRLFSLPLTIKSVPKDFAQKIEFLNLLGFKLLWQAPILNIIEQPLFLPASTSSEWFYQLFTSLENINEPLDWCKKLGNLLFDAALNLPLDVKELAHEWIKEQQQGPWCYFSEQQLQNELISYAQVEDE